MLYVLVYPERNPGGVRLMLEVRFSGATWTTNPDHATKWSTCSDAAGAAVEYRDLGLTPELLTKANAWESGMTPAWEIEAERQAAEAIQ